ncbi:DUF2804 domain-containing protein [Roseateles oligotrophus]|uniref:DUF2804 domain-containing protein n=1 Tax=Roseateles oligotrophus TaxID=1769250 RepID=A0ABT2Y9C3_9BURK|nr:DUF2804 domain-containing protein [Roseateles oligotrophus]MCV2366910.1 DUF2804 domain-containing protein [Roseateles oligotrophus]
MVQLAGPPAEVVSSGAPATGRYAGRIARIDWRALSGPFQRSWLWRRLHHKRWQYVGLGNDELFIGLAIVDLGWTCTAFAYVFDRRSKSLLANWRQDGLPSLQCKVSDRPLNGCKAWFRGPGASLSLQHQQATDSLSLSVQTGEMQLQADLSLAEAAPILLAIGPIEHGAAHATQKTPALSVKGQLHVKGQTYSLDQAVASVDSSNGLLARNTDWRWACAHSPEMGFNLQSGYFGSNENALWLHGALIPLGAARFEFDPKRPLEPWRISTADGLLDLSFSPEGARQEDRNLIIAASHYIQPIGTFSGMVRASLDAPAHQVKGLLGVTEDHQSRW